MMLTIKYKVNYAALADGFWQELEREGESECQPDAFAPLLRVSVKMLFSLSPFEVYVCVNVCMCVFVYQLMY